VCGVRRSGGFFPGRKQCHIPLVLSPQQLATRRDVRDAPRVERPNALVEQLPAFEEKLSFLDERDFEPGEVDQFLVRLDGGKVGIGCGVDRGLSSQGVTEVEADGPNR